MALNYPHTIENDRPADADQIQENFDFIGEQFPLQADSIGGWYISRLVVDRPFSCHAFPPGTFGPGPRKTDPNLEGYNHLAKEENAWVLRHGRVHGNNGLVSSNRRDIGFLAPCVYANKHAVLVPDNFNKTVSVVSLEYGGTGATHERMASWSLSPYMDTIAAAVMGGDGVIHVAGSDSTTGNGRSALILPGGDVVPRIRTEDETGWSTDGTLNPLGAFHKTLHGATPFLGAYSICEHPDDGYRRFIFNWSADPLRSQPSLWSAAPYTDDVNISDFCIHVGAQSLSGLDNRGGSFFDTVGYYGQMYAILDKETAPSDNQGKIVSEIAQIPPRYFSRAPIGQEITLGRYNESGIRRPLTNGLNLSGGSETWVCIVGIGSMLWFAANTDTGSNIHWGVIHPESLEVSSTSDLVMTGSLAGKKLVAGSMMYDGRGVHGVCTDGDLFYWTPADGGRAFSYTPQANWGSVVPVPPEGSNVVFTGRGVVAHLRNAGGDGESAGYLPW